MAAAQQCVCRGLIVWDVIFLAFYRKNTIICHAGKRERALNAQNKPIVSLVVKNCHMGLKACTRHRFTTNKEILYSQ